ncbi:MAG: hypothetical protein IH957_03520 [Chloroflexi bacterium]|nr:hypothetical protein [Chloroflexota bacterium]
MLQALKRALSNNEDGQALVLGVIVFATLVMFVALALDVGDAYGDRARVQRAADSASLAAAQVMTTGGTTAEAISSAFTFAESNGYPDSRSDTSVAVNIPPLSGPYAGDPAYVEVIIDHEDATHFAQILSFDIWNISARAVSSGIAPFNGVMPWAVLEDVINTDGTPTVIKYDASNPTNGNFAALGFGLGSKIYENNIKYGVEGPICADSEPTCIDPTEETQTGNLMGGTRDGVNYRIDNTIPGCDEFTEVFTPDGSGGWDFLPGCNPFVGDTGSLRVLLVPVVDTFCNGKCTVTLKYFTILFLNDLGPCKGNSCEITGTFVQNVYNPSVDLGIELGLGLTTYLAE